MCVMGNEYALFLCFSKRNALQLKRTIISETHNIPFPLIFCYLKRIYRSQSWSLVRHFITQCIHYSLLCNKLTQTLAAESTDHLLSYSFCRTGIWEQCSWMNLTKGISQSCNQGVTWDCSHFRLMWRTNSF